MKYVVSSVLGCAIGPGDSVRLTASQIASRLHALTVIDEKTGEVEPKIPLVFKRGEVINLAAKPDELNSYQKTVLEPVAKAKPAPAPVPAATPDGGNDPAPAA